MSGTFAQWQPRYAEHHVATFPAEILPERKKPKVSHADRVGLPYSAQLALRFPEADAFAFYAGPRSGITVVDLDTSDESMVADAFAMYGPTPFVVRTPSRKGFHLYYRHSGEPRRVRHGASLDMLGGGIVIAPPSQAPAGRYQIIAGTLEDLDHLPRLRQDNKLDEQTRSTDELIHEGKRHDELKDRLAEEVWHTDDFDSFLDRAMTIGTMHMVPPIGTEEVTDLAKWYWERKAKGQLWRRGHRHWTEDAADLARVDRDAGAVLTVLRVEHPGENHRFVVANAMAKMLRMDRKRFAAKRDKLQAMGLIRLVKPATITEPALYRWP